MPSSDNVVLLWLVDVCPIIQEQQFFHFLDWFKMRGLYRL